MPEGLAELATVVDQLAAQDLDRLAGSIRVQRARRLRWLIDRLEGQRRRELAGLDAIGAAATDPRPRPLHRQLATSAAADGAGAACDAVRTTRALFRGPLVETARASPAE